MLLSACPKGRGMIEDQLGSLELKHYTVASM